MSCSPFRQIAVLAASIAVGGQLSAVSSDSDGVRKDAGP
jgi:hypothetical protein